MVVFDPQSRQLILRNRNRGIERPTTETSCPHCGRPYDHNNSSAVEDDYVDEQQPSFINNEYFRMLASSLPSSNRSSTPPSPRRQLAQPVRSPLSSAPIVPPPQAEFIGSSPAPPDPAHGISESAFAPNYFEKFFVVEKELGRGGRGVVLLVRHLLDNVALGHFACKRVPVGDDHAWLEKVLVEVQALQSLSHQNLVSYRHVWLQDYQTNSFSPSVPCAFILQQYCNGGDLHSYICGPAQVQTTAQDLKERMRRRSRGEAEMPRKLNEPRKLSFDQIYSFFLDITEGLRFLHLYGFIHRDLKPSNCLLHNVGGETRVLVSDFGEVQYANAIRKSTGHTGTISYCAPEVLRPVSPGGPLGNFTLKSDIFSLGMILHFLCFADLPYHSANVLAEENEDLDELRDEIISWRGFDERRRERQDLPSKLYAVLKQLLSIHPESRPTADEVRQIVRMGSIDFAPDLKRRGSQTGPEDLAPGKRITKIDSPATGNSSKPINRQRDIEAMSPSRQMRRRGPRSPSLGGPASGAPSPRMSSEEIEDNTTYSALMMRRSSSHGVGVAQPPRLNPRPYAHVSNSTSPESPRKRISPSPERAQQLLLLPPDPQSFLTKARELSLLRITTPSFYILIFVAKLMSVVQPCLNHGMNSHLFYLTFVLAALELATFPHPLWRTVLLGAGHAGLLWYAHEKGIWCISAWSLEN